jgi:hypothetical protein
MVAPPGDGEDGPDGDEGVGGGEDDGVGVGDGVEHAGGGAGPLRAIEQYLADGVPSAAAHEPLLKLENAIARADFGAQEVVGDGKDAGGDGQGAGDLGGSLGEGTAPTNEVRAGDAGGEIAVAQTEPGVVAETGEGIERVERIAAETEAALLVGEAGQVVEDDIDVGGDVEAEELGIVADVGDDRDV